LIGILQKETNISKRTLNEQGIKYGARNVQKQNSVKVITVKIPDICEEKNRIG
jgi:hypothetical protein